MTRSGWLFEKRCFYTLTDGSTFLREMMSWPLSWMYDILSVIGLRQSMHIFLKNNLAKFHPDPICYEKALSFLERSPTHWWCGCRLFCQCIPDAGTNNCEDPAEVCWAAHGWYQQATRLPWLNTYLYVIRRSYCCMQYFFSNFPFLSNTHTSCYYYYLTMIWWL